jgi:hypothetical protein
MNMSGDVFQEYEIECIREAAGQRSAKVRVAKPSGTHRSRTYVLDGPEGSSFVKCLDAGCQNPPATLLTLDHEADGYRFFSGWGNGDLALAQFHFFQAFPGTAGRELQVLGVTNLEEQGVVRTLSEVYLDPAISTEHKEAIAGACGRAIAYLVSAEHQSMLDRASGGAAVRRQTDRLLNHPLRGTLLDIVENHIVFPWAYQNRVIGEVNILLPRWIQQIQNGAAPELSSSLDQLSRILTNRELVTALAPGQSADRVIFSPCDRQPDNTLCLLEGGGIKQLCEVDLECWGLETAGRLLGRYLAHWQMATVDLSSRPDRANLAAEEPGVSLYSHLAGVFCYHFLAGDGTDSTELVLRAISLGLAGFHAAIYCLYRTAIDRSQARVLIPRVLDFLLMPEGYLRMAEGVAAVQECLEGLVTETVEQVLEALQPMIDLVKSLSGLPSP